MKDRVGPDVFKKDKPKYIWIFGVLFFFFNKGRDAAAAAEPVLWSRGRSSVLSPRRLGICSVPFDAGAGAINRGLLCEGRWLGSGGGGLKPQARTVRPAAVGIWRDSLFYLMPEKHVYQAGTEVEVVRRLRNEKFISRGQPRYI